MQKPLLSIGIIFKNEIRCLERCLKSFHALRAAIPCEIVMADTGSDDGSRGIAEKYADIVFDFPWINDFSAARNAVIDRCSGEWFLTVDADEWLEGDGAELAAALRNPSAKKMGYGFVTVRNYVSPNFEDGYNDFLALRIMLMSTGNRYAGAIHESLTGVTEAFKLRQTVLLHDGYALESLEARQKKYRRNLELLAPLLEQEPDSCRRAMQCMESAFTFPEEAMRYAKIGVDTVRHRGDQWEYFGPAIYRQAVWNAEVCSCSKEAEEWREEGAALFPDSPYTQVDLNCSWLNDLYKRKEYARALEKANLYLDALEKYNNNRYPVSCLSVSALKATRRSNLVEAILIQADCLRCLRRYSEAKEKLSGLPLSDCSNDNLVVYIKLLRYLYLVGLDTGDLVYPLLPVLKKPASDDEAGKKRRSALLPTVFAFFNPMSGQDEEDGLPNRPAYPIFAVLECDLGRAARLMDASTPVEGAKIAAEVEDWGEVTIPAIAHMMGLGLPLPDDFYGLGAENLRMVAQGMMTAARDLTADVLAWSQYEGHGETLLRLQFLFEVAVAALRTEAWVDIEKGMALCRAFETATKDYTVALYSAALLKRETDWDALPPMHHFALHYLRARDALQSGDKAGYVHELGQALKVAPVMKPMVEFLQAHTPELQEAAASAELLALAEQIRTVLASFASDNPAVVALKSSEAYQKVAYLIEGAEVPVVGGLPQ